MAFYALNMLNIALELAKHNPVYEDIASKFFEVSLVTGRYASEAHLRYQHFIFIADAMTFKGTGDNELSLWNEQDGLYYDAIQFSEGHSMQLPVRSLVGLIPLYATLVLEPSVVKRFPSFSKRMQWFLDNRSEISQRNMANMKGKRISLTPVFDTVLTPPNSWWSRRAASSRPRRQGPSCEHLAEDA
jgi:hypothetical protein